IKPGGPFNIHSKPYPYQGYQIIGNTREIQGKQVHASKKSVTSAATYYLIDGYGWINGKTLSTLDKYDISKTTRDGKVTSKTTYFYKEPFNTMGTERTGKTSAELYQKDVKITKKATKGGKDYHYYVDGYGWIGAGSIFLYDVAKYEKLNMDLQVKPDANYNIHSKPYAVLGYQITGNTKSKGMNSKKYHISQMATTSRGVYYEVQKVGWINKNAFS
ncbi:SH3-like domain-containing protein, partial [Acinetobacter baumannii]|uniref:SH3-like domain-containing protein n=1 Tax=Acinetobacter baumannii TaxID=470 RepID=UPI001AEC8C58